MINSIAFSTAGNANSDGHEYVVDNNTLTSHKNVYELLSDLQCKEDCLIVFQQSNTNKTTNVTNTWTSYVWGSNVVSFTTNETSVSEGMHNG